MRFFLQSTSPIFKYAHFFFLDEKCNLHKNYFLFFFGVRNQPYLHLFVWFSFVALSTHAVLRPDARHAMPYKIFAHNLIVAQGFRGLQNNMQFNTGWPKSKFEICFGYNSKNMHFWPYVAKAKMCLGAESLFSFYSCLFTIFSCLFTIFQNKLSPPKHILALPT